MERAGEEGFIGWCPDDHNVASLLKTKLLSLIGGQVGRKDLEKQGIINVLLKRADLANVDLTKKGVPIAELVACANVLISPEPCTCNSILLNIW